MKKIKFWIVSLLVIFSIFVGQISTFAQDGSDYKEKLEKQMEPITRGELARLINRAVGYDDPDVEPFPDVPQGNPYYTEMNKAKKAGYLTGNGDGYGYPNNHVSKAQAAVIFVRVLGWDTDFVSVHEKAYPPELQWAAPSLEIMKYLDIYRIDSYAKETLTWGEAERMVQKLANAKEIPIENPYSVKQVRVQDDFFTYVNNSWLASTKIESGSSNVSTFTEISSLVDTQIKGILEECVRNQHNFSEYSKEWKMAELYKMYLNTEVRNELGLAPLRKYINLIFDAETPEQLAEAVVFLNENLGTGYLYYFNVASDEMDRQKHALYLNSSYLGIMGDPYYYLSKEEYPEAIRQEYKNYLKNLILLIEPDSIKAEKKAEKVFEFEKKLSEAHAMGGTNHDVSTYYNAYSVSELEKLTPNLRLDQLVYNRGFLVNKVIVTNPEEVAFFDAYFTKANMEELQYYLFCAMITQFSSLLSEEIGGLYSDFYNRLTGTEGTKSMEQQAIDLVGTFMPDAVSEQFVLRFSSKTAKNDVESLVKEVIRTYRSRLQKNDWLQEETKREAIVKLEKMGIRVGYPSKWNDYSYLEVKTDRDDGNLIAVYESIIQEKKRQDLKNISQGVNRLKWDVAAYDTNAYYDVNTNSIIIPAGILQSPIYEENMSREEKLGGIGVIIGHEVSHAFDTIGAQYDEYGNIRNWWSPGDYEKFRQRARRVAEYYSEIEIIEGETIDGYMTLSESVADLGGISCALDILDDMAKYDARKFFETQAKVFRNKARKENVLFSLSFDAHNPMIVRVNHTLNMFDEFYKTYHIQPGDGMYVSQKDRISVW